MHFNRGQFYLTFVQAEDEGKEAYEAFFLKCEKLRADLQATLREYDGMATVSFQNVDGSEAFEIETQEPDPKELLNIIMQKLGRFGLLDRARRIATH